jgi:type IV pilus assembly protein PilY1
MNNKTSKSAKRSQPVRQWWAGPAAFLASLLALPASAGIKIPDDPLTTSARVAPNILFILDDSGSMAWRNMNSQDVSKITGSGGFSSTPDANGVSAGTGYSSESSGNAAMYMQSYVTNSLYYNPAVTYQPWMGADGNRLTGGTDYTNAYSDGLYVTHAGAGTSSGARNLSSNTQTFYVPRDVNNSGVSYLSNVSNYYRYQIVPGGSDIQRGVYGSIVTSNSQVVQIDGKNLDDGTLASGTAVDNRTASVPVGASLSIAINNTTDSGNRSLNYWVSDSSGVEVCSGSVSRGNSRSCFVPKTIAGQYVIRVQRGTNNSTTFSLSASRYTTNRCDDGTSGYGWIDCVSANPTTRTVAAEKVNFATWYSYHRTRVKAAKAGAAEAFSPLDSKVRVGFRTIHSRRNFDIPVNDGNDGRFVNNVADPKVTGSRDTTSRTTWYERLFGAGANDGTPLPAALEAAGQYFSDASSSGPYGPESGKDQLSCRQNFSILTTDGYWNTNAGSGGNADGSAGTTIKGAKGKEFTYAAVAPYMDSYSNTLADVAMKYWRSDLRTESYMGNTANPDNNNVPTSDADPAFWQHMVTFGISIGLKTTRGWSSVDDVPANPSWPDPGTDKPNTDKAERIDDLLHAAVNGRGQFVAASSPAEFTSGLGKALAAISQRTGSFSNVSTNSTSLNTGSMVFSASYMSGVWTGQVKGQTVSRAGVSGGWTSSIPAVGSRKVFTFNGTSGTSFPTASQQAALARVGGPADYPVTGADNASYIKGDASNEERNGGVLRNRPNTVLGDIVGSSPTYVKETNTLYVGANDGMLHAFDAGSGEELFAYVPSMLNFNQLATLSRQDYSHKFFVDGPVVATNRALTPNKNILIGALGRGGKGLYALDVSKPAAATASSVFAWERTETPGNNMGQVFGRPILSRVQSGAPAVVFGNGINSTGEKAVLVVLNAETGAVIREIDTGTGSAGTPNGLSAPTGVYGPDGKTLAYVYAGDMLGNVWKFDLTSSSPGSWSAKRLFTAKDAGGTAQPISAGVTVATHPLNGKRWVFFGTGRYLTVEDADSSTADSQSMYGFMDDGVALSRSDLTTRTIELTGETSSGYPVRAFEAKAGLPAGSKGWYVDLPEKGERIVQDAQVVATFLITASMIPTGAACDPDGRGYINALDAYTGTSAGGSYFDLDNDPKTDDQVKGLPVGSVDAGVGMPTLPNLMRGLTLLGGSGGGVAGLPTRRPSWDRVSWREIKGD